MPRSVGKGVVVEESYQLFPVGEPMHVVPASLFNELKTKNKDIFSFFTAVITYLVSESFTVV